MIDETVLLNLSTYTNLKEQSKKNTTKLEEQYKILTSLVEILRSKCKIKAIYNNNEWRIEPTGEYL